MPKNRIVKDKREVEECNEETKLLEKIKNDFIQRKETAMISLEEGNLARLGKVEIPNEPTESKKPKICSTCLYAKVGLRI